MDTADYYALISGERRGAAATLGRLGLACLEPAYASGAALRNAWYDHKPSAVTAVDAPVVSVGNLTVGGTGKTPMVKWIARRLRGHCQASSGNGSTGDGATGDGATGSAPPGVEPPARRVAILSRGYGAEEGSRNDEAMELEQALPDVPHLQGRDRVELARIAIDELESEVLLLDDGFQHRRLGRDLDIVLLDATEPFGFGRLLPRGVLREPVRSLRRADVVCLTRADAVDQANRDAVRRRVTRIAPEALWCEATHRPQTLLACGGESAPIASLAGTKVAAFCGIGNPGAFRQTLEGLGAEITLWRPFADHHNYTAADIAWLNREIAKTEAAMVVCTHKDLVKVQSESLADRPLRAAVVDIEFLAGEAALAAKIDAVASRKP